MELNCYCGSGFNLSPKEARLLLQEFEWFCSPSCLLKYILEASEGRVIIEAREPFVSTPYECWDRVTNQMYRSMYEVYTARFLKENGIKFKYEHHGFPVGNSVYTPDFWLPEKNLHIECKGRWGMSAKTKTKKIGKLINLIFLPAYLQKKFEREYKTKYDIVGRC